MTLYDESQLRHIIRYIEAVIIRSQRGVVDLDKDRRKVDQIEPFSRRLNALVQSLSAGASLEKHAAVEAFFWLLEEYKISIFAQEIKTAQPVSAKRLEAKLKEIEGIV
jgi:ATP-dependent helicase HrpA